MKLKTILTLGLATLLMTACQKDEGIEYDPMQGLSYPILIDGIALPQSIVHKIARRYNLYCFLNVSLMM